MCNKYEKYLFWLFAIAYLNWKSFDAYLANILWFNAEKKIKYENIQNDEFKRNIQISFDRMIYYITSGYVIYEYSSSFSEAATIFGTFSC